ncbi:site-specific integrase, partial [Ectothiorhodospira mobilis]|uniref:site-specific integrase n=1 Tax=Ectothiorhodospira mobilis TaxID=195064 RepID=UPI001C4326BB
QDIVASWALLSRPLGVLNTLSNQTTLILTGGGTEKSYMGWICRFIHHCDGQAPSSLGGAQVADFLQYLAVTRNVSISTQKQALNALAFLFSKVLEKPLGDIGP